MNSRKMSQIDSIFYVIFIFISKYAVDHSLQMYVYVICIPRYVLYAIVN